MSNIIIIFILSLIAGLLPALLWLWFWLHEDREHPEPKSMVSLTFLGGMAVVFLAIPLEQGVYNEFVNSQSQLITVWAAIEEILKFGAALFIGLRSRAYDEPLDAVIYMMCAALGFAALENALFTFSPLYAGAATTTIFTINLRFIGATLLHTLASSVVGVCLAFTFYKSIEYKIVAAVAGLTIATILHTWFNLSIIKSNNGIFIVFSLVWLAIVVLILLLERVKQVTNITK